MNDSARAKDTWNPDYCCRRLDDCKWGGVGPCDSRAYALVAAEQTAALRAEVERLRAWQKHARPFLARFANHIATSKEFGCDHAPIDALLAAPEGQG